jgi:hypothetical protein
MLRKFAAIVSLLNLFGSIAFAAPITINFSGIQANTPYSYRAAPNFLGISRGQTVSGSYVVDIAGGVQINNTANNPLRAYYANEINSYAFSTVSGYGSAIDYSYYVVDASNNILQFYINDTHGNISDVYGLNLYLKPGVIENDSFSLSSLSADDISSFGVGSSSDWSFQRTYYSGSSYSQIQYRGYLTSVSVTPYLPRNVTTVPEPPTSALIAIALVLIAVGSKIDFSNTSRKYYFGSDNESQY